MNDRQLDALDRLIRQITHYQNTFAAGLGPKADARALRDDYLKALSILAAFAQAVQDTEGGQTA